MKEIPLPANATSMDVTDMNNLGQVVGYVTLGEGTERYRAFFWSEADGFRPIGSLVGSDGISMALSINEEGDVRGLSEGPHSNLCCGPMGIVLEDAFVWNAKSGMKAAPMVTGFPGYKPANEGGKLRLPAGADCADVVRVNASGQAIGYAGSKGKEGCKPTNALFWEADGKYVVIGQCGPRSWCSTSVSAINNRGEVVGYADYAGFRWTASGGMVRLPMDQASVNVINDSGDAAGTVRVRDPDIYFPIVWMASGGVRTIEMPAGATYGFPVRINNSGVVVGSFQ